MFALSAVHPSCPPPYRAMLAICSDLDETPDAATYFELMRFLNTTEETTMGPGVGLEVGNTIYFDMAPGQVSYWNASERDRERFRALIRSGHIDCLHSFGDLATTRAHAARALEELGRHGCQLKVWIDHAQAITNLGADIMQGRGDVPGHAAYHADLTLAYGIQYVWRGRVTSMVGQGRAGSFRGIWNARHPVGSSRTLAKEFTKQVLARCGRRKYALHAGNPLVRRCRLRDGAESIEFLRANPHWRGVSAGDTGSGLGEVLNRRFLDRLVARGASCVLYTHMGKLPPGTRCFPPATVAAFRLLAEYAHGGKILVTTTRRLLDFHSASVAAPQPAAPPSWPPLAYPDLA